MSTVWSLGMLSMTILYLHETDKKEKEENLWIVLGSFAIGLTYIIIVISVRALAVSVAGPNAEAFHSY